MSESAKELAEAWKGIIAERKEVLSGRENNWMLGPVGIEEAVSITRVDVGTIGHFLNRVILLLEDAEKRNVLPAPPERTTLP